MATGVAVTGWLAPRIYNVFSAKDHAIHLQSFSTGSAVELLWVVVMCGVALGLYGIVGTHHSSRWMRLLLAVILPATVIYVHHITIGSRYAIVSLAGEEITLSGRPFSQSRSFNVSEISKLHLVNRNDGEELELEFILKSGDGFRTCRIFGADPEIVSRLHRLLDRLRQFGLEFTESNMTAIRPNFGKSS